MVVVFSGFGATGNFTYDFKNVLNEMHSNVLWIKDDFYGNITYYHSVNNKEIHPIINDFILDIAQKNNIKKDNIILSGFSKGGSAALFYGLKYDYKKIISTVPQVKIATYCQKSHKDVLLHMLGEDYTKESFEALDNSIQNVLSRSCQHKNIYLLTSKADEQYKDQVDPFLDDFYSFSNFNLFYSESILVRTHNQVTSHHVQLVLSWLYSLIAGLTPYYGVKTIKGDPVRREKIDLENYTIELRCFKINDTKIYPEGVGLVRNYDFQDWSDVNYFIIFENEELSYELPLAKAHRPQLTREFYNGNFSIYDKSCFTTYRYNGIDISHIKKGKYNIKLKIFLTNINEYITKFIRTKKSTFNENEYYCFYGNNHDFLEMVVK